MEKPLTTYLNDHLGGAQIAIQILEAMCERHDDVQFRKFAQELLPEVQADDYTLRSLVEEIGETSNVKQIGGWLVEKAARLKLGHTGSTNFELFESLELLVLGIHGKLSLWKALQEVAKLDTRLCKLEFAELIRRAQQQYGKVERARIELASVVLAPVR